MIKEKVEYKTNCLVSRFRKYPVYKTDFNLYFGIPTYLEIPETQADQYFCVTQKYVDRIDLIANKFYADSKLWWVIAKANNILDPQVIPMDSILRIPDRGTVFGIGGVV